MDSSADKIYCLIQYDEQSYVRCKQIAEYLKKHEIEAALVKGGEEGEVQAFFSQKSGAHVVISSLSEVFPYSFIDLSIHLDPQKLGKQQPHFLVVKGLLPEGRGSLSPAIRTLRKDQEIVQAIRWALAKITPHVVIVVQARMGSERLQGKVLRPLCGKPLLQHLVERLALVRQANQVIVATSDYGRDDPIEALCHTLRVDCVRGSEHDVLDRYVQAMEQSSADVIVRITADCPLISPELIDQCIQKFLSQKVDLCAAMSSKGFPRGFDTEVISREALLRVYGEDFSQAAREHVTWGIHQHPEKFQVDLLESSGALHKPQWRLCVDEEDDFRLIQTLYENLYRGEPIDSGKLLDFLEQHPELQIINAQVVQKSPQETDSRPSSSMSS